MTGSSGRQVLVAAMVFTAIVLLAVPSATAQTPSTAGVTIIAAPVDDTVGAPGQCLDSTVTVRSTATVALTPTQTHTVSITTSQTPSNWELRTAPPSQVQVAPQGEAQFPVSLCASANAPPLQDVTITITATVTDQGIGNPSDEVTLTARLAEQSTLAFDLPDTFLWLILGSLVVLVGVILLARSKTTHGITLTCPEPAKEVEAGRGTSFPIRIRNEGGERDLISLEVSPVPNGWETFLPLGDMALDRGEEQTVWLSLRSPENAQPGEEVRVRLRAVGTGGGGHHANIEMHTRVAGTPFGDGTAAGATASEPTGPGDQQSLEIEETGPAAGSANGPASEADGPDRSVVDERRATDRPVAVKRKANDA